MVHILRRSHRLEAIVTFGSRWCLSTLIAMAFLVVSASAQNMSIRADLTDAPRGIMRGTLSMPVKAGPLTLVYPQWIPGYHSPVGPITDLAGLKFTPNGKPLPWRRDLADM